jgi:hypothetical protein
MRRKLLGVVLLAYAATSAAAGIFLAEGTLHPVKRALTTQNEAWLHNTTNNDLASEAVSIVASDGVELRAWSLHPKNRTADAVILLHGLGDNPSGMTGYAGCPAPCGFCKGRERLTVTSFLTNWV